MFLWPFKLAFRVVGIVLAVVLLYVGVTIVQVWLTSMANDPHHADAAIVFGTAANPRTPRPDLAARLQRALSLFQKGLVPIIAVTGGKERGDLHTESWVSATWLEARGVPSSSIVEGGGDDTWQNVNAVAAQLHADGVHSVLVVTDPFHEDRAMAIVSDFGFSPSATPSQHSPIGGPTLVVYLAKEGAEVAAGRIIGYGTLSDWFHS
jgi:uncharacterized SAM-binding protein YcdF (DUF218 family)